MSGWGRHDESNRFDRRRLLAGGAAAALALTPAHLVGGENPQEDTQKGPIQAAPAADSSKNAAPAKAKVRWAVHENMVASTSIRNQQFPLIKECDFDGVEIQSPGLWNAKDLREQCRKTDLAISSLSFARQWHETFASSRESDRVASVDSLKSAIRLASEVDAPSITLVPGMVNEFVSYEVAYSRIQEELRKVLPTAEKYRVRLLISNATNKFLLSPLEMARFIDEFESPWVGAHLNISAVLQTGYPEHWIRYLGPRLGSLYVGDFDARLAWNEGIGKAYNVAIWDGDCHWHKVRTALQEIRFDGWAIATHGGGPREKLLDVRKRMYQAILSEQGFQR